MSVSYGFYNSIDGDRKYNALQMSSIFDGLITDGIFSSIGTAFVVTASGGLTVNVGIGRAWFNHTWTLNDAVLPLQASESELILDRIDAVILEVNTTESVRANSIKIINGTPASSPERPALVKDGIVYQYPLCYIDRKAGSTQITQADITNMVGTSSTPFVTGILQTVSLDVLLGQWQDQLDQFVEQKETDFDEWSSVQQQDYSIWSDEQKEQFQQWAEQQESMFSDWASGQTLEEETWIESMQQTFLSWFKELQTELSGDVAANLQLQLDKEETQRILLSGFVDGNKTFNADGTVITSTDSSGRTLTKTFTDNFSTVTSVLRSVERGEIARMVRKFNPDGTLITTEVTYT